MTKSKFDKLLETVSPETIKLVRKQNEIADKIYRLLKQRNLTQKEFAQQLGMKESQLCKILAANANLTLKTIVKIETALNEEIVAITDMPAKMDHLFVTAADQWCTDTYPKSTAQIVPLSLNHYKVESSLSLVADSLTTYGHA